MPTIIVQTHSADAGKRAVTLVERALPVSLHSEHYLEQLIERLAWALLDAERLEGERGQAAGIRASRERARGRRAAPRPSARPANP